ncbi:FecR domain-containing protein [Cupriavidus metallidurans]|uniref:FecR domain-containing protein n=1 Tax=Cupriavidus TaxID=106589 RepID=UPI00257D5F35|nr:MULTISPECIES: FecR domain-containing protein [unclassified Cupriavidus]GMG93210.1 iron uptake regulator [Cupriavidus sp. TKC]
MSAQDLGIPPHVARAAVEWLVTLQGGETNEASLAAWRHWLSQHPDHARAWARIEAVNARLRDVASPLTTAVAHAALTPPRSASRRRAVQALVVAFTGGAVAWAARDHAPLQDWLADVHTAVGEQRLLSLADGTQVRLNTDTAIDIAFTSTERRVLLRRGEIHVQTAPDHHWPTRPFIVATASATLRPMGTRFAVRVSGDAGWIGVTEGAVAVRPQADPTGGRIIAAGKQARFTPTSVDAPTPLPESDTAWTDGMIVATDMRLADFLAEVDRYRPGRLRCAPDVADLRVSGTFPIADTDRILDALRTALPVRIQFLTRYWTTVLPA